MGKHSTIKAMKCIKRNIRSLLIFEMIFKVGYILIGICIFFSLYKHEMNRYQYASLHKETLLVFLKEPSVLCITILLYIFTVYGLLVELQSMIICFHASYHKKTIRTSDMLRQGVRCVNSWFKKGDFKRICIAILLMPLVSIASLLAIQHYVAIIHQPSMLLLWIILIFCSMFALQAIVIMYPKQESNAFEYDKQATKISVLSLFSYVMLGQCLLYVIATICIFIIGSIGVCLLMLSTDGELAYLRSMKYLYNITLFVYGLLCYISIPFGTLFMSAYVYVHSMNQHRGDISFQEEHIRKRTCRKHQSIVCMFSLLALVCMQVIYGKHIVAQDAHNRFLPIPQIVAHRGDSVHAPENSIPAFKKAIKTNVEVIELDVQQTKDGVIVAFHDRDLKRMAGVDKKICDMTYEEILQYDIGSWYGTSYKGMKITTLDNIIKQCKGDINFLIELKTSGKEYGFEDKVMRIIKQYHAQSSCIMTSKSVETLATIRKIDSHMEIMYITNQYDTQLSFMDVDGYSIKAQHINQEIVHDIHRQGKKVAAWKVDDDAYVDDMLAIGVDMIISDDPMEVTRRLWEKMTPIWLTNILSFLFESM